MKTFEQLKESKDLKVKDWFIKSIYEKMPSYYNIVGDPKVEFVISKESEKAVEAIYDIETVDGEYSKTFKTWIPKACFESYSDYESAKIERFEDGKKRYEAMINFCKENNIKGVRNGFRKETILSKIKSAGLSYNY